MKALRGERREEKRQRAVAKAGRKSNRKALRLHEVKMGMAR